MNKGLATTQLVSLGVVLVTMDSDSSVYGLAACVWLAVGVWLAIRVLMGKTA